MNNAIAASIAQAIAQMDGVVSTRLVVLKILNTILDTS
jgi:type III secretory pathway lipoprotein EscJ